MTKEYIPKIKILIKKISYIILIEILIFVIFVGYEFINWRKNINTLNSLTNELMTKSEMFTNLNIMDKESDNILINIDESKKRLFTKDEYEIFISNLPSRLINFNIKDFEIDVGGENFIIENNEDYKEVQVYLIGTGTIDSIEKFLVFIENNEKIIKVLDLTLNLTNIENEYTIDLSLILPITY